MMWGKPNRLSVGWFGVELIGLKSAPYLRLVMQKYSSLQCCQSVGLCLTCTIFWKRSEKAIFNYDSRESQIELELGVCLLRLYINYLYFTEKWTKICIRKEIFRESGHEGMAVFSSAKTDPALNNVQQDVNMFNRLHSSIILLICQFLYSKTSVMQPLSVWI